MAFGYRIFQVQIGKRGKPDVRYNFDNVALHSEGALGLFKETLEKLLSKGERDKDRLTYFTIEGVQSANWAFLVTATGGQWGRSRRVRDTNTGTDRPPIGADDAVLDDLPMLLVIPNHGTQGLLVAATQGRSHSAFAFARVVNSVWKDKSLSLKLTSDLADQTAWATFLGQTDIDVTHVELIQTAVTKDRPSFGKPGRVSRARVVLTISDANTRKNVIARVKDRVFNHHSLKLAGVLGMGLKDDQFDDYRVLYVQDGRQKALSISNEYPHFIYPLEGTAPPSAADLADAAVSDVEYLLKEMNVAFPSDWLSVASQRTNLKP